MVGPCDRRTDQRQLVTDGTLSTYDDMKLVLLGRVAKFTLCMCRVIIPSVNSVVSCLESLIEYVTVQNVDGVIFML